MSAINFSFENVTGPVSAREPVVATTARLLEICGGLDAQAFGFAVAGFILSIVTLFYFGRARPWLLLRGDDAAVTFADKFLLVMLALCFAAVIVRLMRAG